MTRTKPLKPRDAPVHLYRGATPVRSWYRYNFAINGFSLCGVNHPLFATENALEVSCTFCKYLMRQHSIRAEEPHLPPDEYDSPLHVR